MTEVQPTLFQPMFKDSPLTLGRLLPAGKAAYLGLRSKFCDLRSFFAELQEREWSGHLYTTVEGWRAHVLMLEGKAVAAACREDEGELALSSVQDMWNAGATLSGFRLEAEIVRTLSGVRGPALPEAPPSGFSGVWMSSTQTELWLEGRAVGRMLLPSSEHGIYPMPGEPRTIALSEPLPRSLLIPHTLTLRGRDALSPITHTYASLRRELGHVAIGLLEHIRDGKPLSEYLQAQNLAPAEAVVLLERMVGSGFLRLEG